MIIVCIPSGKNSKLPPNCEHYGDQRRDTSATRPLTNSTFPLIPNIRIVTHLSTNIFLTENDVRDALHLEPSNVANCVSKGKSEHFDCRNHIRVIQPMGDGNRLYMCGTNAHSPKDWVIYSNLTHLPRHEFVPGVGMGIAKCPYDPADNSTAVWVEKGNPGDLPALYSGTNAEFTKADTVIFRTDLYNLTTGRKAFSFKRTLKYDSKWLDTDVKQAMACSTDDTCRLNENSREKKTCESIYKVPGDDTHFYGTFTTSTNGLMGSAICSFHIDAIQEAFRGKFKEQATSSSAWLPVLSNKVPEPRPGQCVNDTETFPDTVLNFIRSHPLMDSAISHENEKPVFYKRDVMLTRLVVDKLRIDFVGLDLDYTVYYAGSKKFVRKNLYNGDGRVHKVVQWIDNNGESQSILLDVFDVTPGEPIQAMEISKEHKALYVASDHRIKQIDLVMCTRRYDNCLRCVHDPYCGWDKDTNTCKPYEPGLLQDVSNSTADVCDSSVGKRKLVVTWGQSVHLGCFVKMPEVLANQEVRWYHYSKEKGRYQIAYKYGAGGDKFIETSEKGLVIVGVNEQDAGRYDCWLGGSLLCSYNITVDAHRCSAPAKSNDYQKIYSDWCHEFEKYKSAMKSWERKQAIVREKHVHRFPSMKLHTDIIAISIAAQQVIVTNQVEVNIYTQTTMINASIDRCAFVPRSIDYRIAKLDKIQFHQNRYNKTRIYRHLLDHPTIPTVTIIIIENSKGATQTFFKTTNWAHEKREMKDRRDVRLNTIIGKLILEYVLIMSFKQVLDSIMSIRLRNILNLYNLNKTRQNECSNRLRI
ncbi:Semaphorin-2A [Apis cerana cerana]|uniref:Semaphorin-2A n=1 Tax=Apis cerana cerana TaxID=94128 RepID=A0A2A3EPW6_APICC|nr:Semaphorin-2A [Apis cerana cerana]